MYDDEKIREWTSQQNNLKIFRSDISTFQTTDDIKYICGIDISFLKDTNKCASCAVLLDFKTLEVIKHVIEIIEIDEPYIFGFLSFREVKPMISVFNKLVTESSIKPDIVLVDGSGYLHPNNFGLACHLGVLLNIPTIGVAKNYVHIDGIYKKELLEKYEKHTSSTNILISEKLIPEKSKRRNQSKKEELYNKNTECMKIITRSGKVLGSMTGSKGKPLYISVGHRINLELAEQIVKKCMKFKNPEPIRQADLISRDFIRNNNYVMTEV